MKKKNKKIIISVSAIVVLAFVIALFSGKLPFSAVSFQELTCSKSDLNSWTCSNFKGSVSAGSDGKIYFSITKPSSVSEWTNLYFQTARDISPDLQEFLNTHTVITWDTVQSNSYNTYEPYDTQNNWLTRLPGMQVHQYYSNFGWDMKWAVASNIIKTQFVVVEGTYNDRCPSGTSSNHSTMVRTYGLCNGRPCWVKDLFPNTEYQIWSNPGNAGTTCGLLEVNSIKVYSKNGGYTEEEGKEEFGFNIKPDISVYRLINNQCQIYIIKESEKTSNDYLTEDECKSKIIEEEIEENPLITEEVSKNKNWIYVGIGIIVLIIVTILIIRRRK